MDPRLPVFLSALLVIFGAHLANFQRQENLPDTSQLSTYASIIADGGGITPVSLFHASIFPSCSTNGFGFFRKSHLGQHTKKPISTFIQTMLVILMSGDVQMNPGPQAKYPCGICNKNVRVNQKAMECETCLAWFHNKCTGMNDVLYQVHMEHESYTWICYRCGMPNFTNSTLFGILSTSNSFDALSNLEEGSSINIDLNDSNTHFGSPKHTSSPTKVRPESKHKYNTTRGRKPMQRQLKLMNINFQSIRNKIPAFQALIEKEKPDVIFGTETWLDNSVYCNEILPSNYQFFRKDRNTTTIGGGVLLAIRDNLIAKDEPDLYSETCESVWASIHMKGSQAAFFGVFYRPESGNKKTNQQCILELDEILHKIPKSSHIWLAGDFNLPDINWEKNSFIAGGRYPAVSKQVLELVAELNLAQTVHIPTREESILDLVFTNTPSFVQDVYIVPGLGDHDIVTVDALLTPQRIKLPRRKVYLYKKGNFDEINKDIQNFADTLTDDVIQNSSVNDLWLSFKSLILTSMEKHIPSKLSKSGTQLPWVRRAHIRMIRQKQRMYNKAKKSNKSQDWTKFKKFRRTLDRDIRKSRSEFLHNVGESLESGDTKPFWRFIKNSRNNFSGVAALNTELGTATSATEKANALNDQFKSVFTNEDCSSIPTLPEGLPSMPPIEITVEGIEKLLKGLKVRKAPGPDGLTPTILKECASAIAPILTILYQKSVSTGELPMDWIQANVTPLYKKGNRSEPENYRPVSLTSIPCKLLEHVIYSNVMSHLEKYEYLNDKQHGFRSSRSCESQLALTVNDLAKILDDKGQVDIIIMDFSKAFDTVPHERLLAKISHAGIHGPLHTWIRNFLTRRSQQVVLEGATSYPTHVTSGVPQGTVLGPLLFLLYINDISDDITSEVRLFADDCIMYRRVKNKQDGVDLQRDIDRLCEWERRWQMKFNKAKCYAMHITHKKSQIETNYHMGDSVLQTVSNHTYLGVEINNKLSWSNHVLHVTSRANQILGLLRRTLYSCSPKVKNISYKALVRPRLEYCASVWDPHQKEYINKLEGVQRRAARFVSQNNKPRDSVTEMISHLKWEPLEHRRANQRLTFIYKSIHKLIAVDTEPYQTKPMREGISTRKHSSVSFIKPTINKDCYKYSLFPRTFAEWNCLPTQVRDAPTLGTFKNNLKSINMGTIIQKAHYKN